MKVTIEFDNWAEVEEFHYGSNTVLPVLPVEHIAAPAEAEPAPAPVAEAPEKKRGKRKAEPKEEPAPAPAAEAPEPTFIEEIPPDEEPAPVAEEPAEAAVTVDYDALRVEVRARLAELNRKYPDMKPAGGVIEGMGFHGFKNVPDEKLPELLKRCEATEKAYAK